MRFACCHDVAAAARLIRKCERAYEQQVNSSASRPTAYDDRPAIVDDVAVDPLQRAQQRNDERREIRRSCREAGTSRASCSSDNFKPATARTKCVAATSTPLYS